jgi:hypothetical protein
MTLGAERPDASMRDAPTISAVGDDDQKLLIASTTRRW